MAQALTSPINSAAVIVIQTYNAHGNDTGSDNVGFDDNNGNKYDYEHDISVIDNADDVIGDGNLVIKLSTHLMFGQM